MKMLQFLAVLFLLMTSLAAEGQSAPQNAERANLVPNPGFEEYAASPLGWFYKGKHFTEVMKYWSSPTAASPDAFGPRVRVPEHWAEKGFGDLSPHGGNSMVGLTVYGCEEGKPHCREYIQIQLLESLVIGQEYSVSFWVGHLPRSLQVDNLGACFTVREVSSPNDEPLLFQPQVNAGGFLEPKQGSWVEVSGRFTATQEANYLIIGNFSLDSHTRIKAPFDDHFPFGYYYVDDVRVKKEEPILPLSLPDDDLSKVKLEAGQVFQLKNLFFETDEAELLPRSYTELNKLLQRMRERPEMVIQVIGHTDNRGEQDYNQGLSERRAKAVVDFLLSNGISAGRVTYQGFGSSRPVAGNETEEGRQLNRRVEFVVVEM